MRNRTHLARTHVAEHMSPRDITQSKNLLNHFRFISVPWTMVQHGLGYSIAMVRQRVRLPLVRYGIAVVM